MATKKEQGHVRIQVDSKGENINAKRILFILETDTQKCPDASDAFRHILYDHEPGMPTSPITSVGMNGIYGRRKQVNQEFHVKKYTDRDGNRHTLYGEDGRPCMVQNGWGQPMGYQGIVAACTVDSKERASIDRGIADVEPFIEHGTRPAFAVLDRSPERQIAYLQACADLAASEMGVTIPPEDPIHHMSSLAFAFAEGVGDYVPAVELIPEVLEKYFSGERVQVDYEPPEGFTLMRARKAFVDPVIRANKELNPDYYGRESRSAGSFFACENRVVNLFVEDGLAEIVDPTDPECTRWNITGKTATYRPESRTPALDALTARIGKL